VKLKVVLDTNLFVAAYFNKKSASAKIIEACLKGKLKVFTSQGLFNELEFILKNIRASSQFKEKVYRILEKAQVVFPSRILVIKEDIEDNKFLAVAKKAKADYLITNDRHLLKIKRFQQTRIITPFRFWQIYHTKLI